MKANYHNLKIADWNFDYARGKRLEIRGAICSLPIEIADQYPQYFKKVEKKEKVITETETEKLVNNIKEENLTVVTEPQPKYEEDLTLEEKFKKALLEKEVKETKKQYEWNSVKFSKEAYNEAEDKEEFLFNTLNK